MDFETAQKLKDAGWKFEPISRERARALESSWVERDKKLEVLFFKLPTLEDLIGKFRSFAKLEHTGKEATPWFAEAWNDAWDEKFRGIGETPLIAVVNLWVALNKK